MSRLEVAGLTAGYLGSDVVRGVDLSVGEGELVALLGANGAGKTTTLLALSGLLKGVGGQISLDGNPLNRLSAVQRARAGLLHVPEDRSLFPTLTVEETLQLAGGSRHIPDRVIRYFPRLGPLAKRRVGALSGGEQQMLALGRALCRDPRVLLVDEMSLGLAPQIVRAFFPVLRQIATELGAGILIVEQHVQLALRAVDRVYVMSGGAIAASGPAEEIRPRIEELTRAYLGD